jgi:hypothetical protein
MVRTVLSLALAFSCGIVTTVHAQQSQPTKPLVFVGPQVRLGFADMDRGVRDSIADVKDELQKAGFRLATQPSEAAITLVILGRGRIVQGSVGVSSGSTFNGTGSGFGVVVPNEVPTLSTVLRVGEYEKPVQTQGGTWKYVAKQVADDLAVWWEVNASEVLRLKQ